MNDHRDEVRLNLEAFENAFKRCLGDDISSDDHDPLASETIGFGDEGAQGTVVLTGPTSLVEATLRRLKLKVE